MDIDLIKISTFPDVGGQYLRFFRIGENNIWFEVNEISQLLKCDIQKDHPEIILGRVFVDRIIHTGKMRGSEYEEKNSGMVLVTAFDILMLLDKVKSEISDELRESIFEELTTLHR